MNDSTTDKVFKYTLAGALVGSWTITGGGGAPTGITLDPSNVAHLWIVDNGADRVYQYDNAAGVTSGSLTASLSFALAPGNTNPQDIADPPVASASAKPSLRRKKPATIEAAAQHRGLSLSDIDWASAVDTVFAEHGRRTRRR